MGTDGCLLQEISALFHVCEPLRNPSKSEAFRSLAPVSALVRAQQRSTNRELRAGLVPRHDFSSYALRNLQSPSTQPMYSGGLAFGRIATNSLAATGTWNKEANCSKASNHFLSLEKEWIIIAAASVLNRWASITAEAVRCSSW